MIEVFYDGSGYSVDQAAEIYVEMCSVYYLLASILLHLF